jgi:hypothetical protein
MRLIPLKPITSSSLRRISSMPHKNEVQSILFRRSETDPESDELSTPLSLDSPPSLVSSRHVRLLRRIRTNANKNEGREARATVLPVTASRKRQLPVQPASVDNQATQPELARRNRTNTSEPISEGSSRAALQ